MSLKTPGPLGPLGPWAEDDENEELRLYSFQLSVEQARATLVCRLEDRLAVLKKAGPSEILVEIKRQIAEGAVDGRVDEIQGLCLQVADILASHAEALDRNS